MQSISLNKYQQINSLSSTVSFSFDSLTFIYDDCSELYNNEQSILQFIQYER